MTDLSRLHTPHKCADRELGTDGGDVGKPDRSDKIVSTTNMDPDTIECLLEEEAGGSSELSKSAYDVGRKVAHFPD